MNQKTELTREQLASLRVILTEHWKELGLRNDDDLRDRITKLKEEKERVKGNNQRKEDEARDLLLAKLENLSEIKKIIKNYDDMKAGSKRVDTSASAINMFDSRTLFLIDGTCSMHYILDKMKSEVATIFERIHNILQSNGINSDSCQVKFAVYRNYTNYEDSILQYSSWETNSKNICTFMDNISSKGGMNNEAIEIALWYANKEPGISQVILIGDAGANTPEEIPQRRSIFSEKYWEKAGFQSVGHYQDELIKLKENKIPVHAFYAHESAKKDFERIASETGGSCEFFVGTSSKGPERLVSLVIEQILRNIGRSNGGNDESLVEIYRKTYCR